MSTIQPIRPEVSILPEKLAVLDPAGELLFWVDETGARDLLRANQARITRRGRVRVLVAASRLDWKSLTGGRGMAFDKTRYSHNHETADNPAKVWTLRRLGRSTQGIFLAVARDCGGVSVTWICPDCGRTVRRPAGTDGPRMCGRCDLAKAA